MSPDECLHDDAQEDVAVLVFSSTDAFSSFSYGSQHGCVNPVAA